MLRITTPKPSLAGHVEMTLVNKRGEVKFHSEFKNMVLDTVFHNPVDFGFYFLDRNRTAMAAYVGADVQTPPLASDTTLNNYIAQAHGSGGVKSVESGLVLGAEAADDYYFTKRVFEFAGDDSNGNLTEVGISPSDTGFRFSRTVIAKTLIKDSNGNPTVVEKREGDILFLSYELRAYRPPNAMSDVFQLGGESYQFYSTTFYRRDQNEGRLGDFLDASVHDWDTDSMRGDPELDEFARNTDQLIYTPSSSEIAEQQIVVAGSDRRYQEQGFYCTNSSVTPNRTVATDVTLEDRQVGVGLFSSRYALGADGGGVRGGILLHSHPSSTLTDGFASGRGFLALATRVHPDDTTGRTSATSTYRLLGVFVDPDTHKPKPVFIPAQHRLSITANPDNLQLVARR